MYTVHVREPYYILRSTYNVFPKSVFPKFSSLFPTPFLFPVTPLFCHFFERPLRQTEKESVVWRRVLRHAASEGARRGIDHGRALVVARP